METEPSIVFITGGVRSGKSRFAEDTASQIANGMGGVLHYVATCFPSDEEMNNRIEKHKQQRLEDKMLWRTWEQPYQISQIAHHFNDNDIVLIDCLTILLNNEMFMNSTEVDSYSSIYDPIMEGIESIANACHSLIIVSNEVLNEPLQNSELIFTYKKRLGTLHRQIVHKADQVYLVESGIPLCMKGANR